jgi:hypothetical protein
MVIEIFIMKKEKNSENYGRGLTCAMKKEKNNKVKHKENANNCC